MAKAVDEEMKDAEPASTSNVGSDAAPESIAESRLSPTDQLAANLAVLEKAVSLKETRMISGRLLRQTASIRHQLTPQILSDFVTKALPEDATMGPLLLKQLKQAASSAMDRQDAPEEATSQTAASTSSLPEAEAYATLIVTQYLVDNKLCSEAKEVTTAAVQRLSEFNRRTLDTLAARIYFYYSWSYECCNSLSEIRSRLLALHRTSVLRHDEYGQETLVNLLLRNYLHYNLYDQAEKFRAKAQRPEQSRSHTQYCRYLFYLGRIKAIQLEYTDARDYLQQAARKAPNSALGFRVTVSKWLILVRLLLGEIPEHQDFTQPGLRQPLQAYYELTQAVRGGDLTLFRRAAETNHKVFAEDKVSNLIVRLRHNVIRAGLRRISLAYSRISLADVASKLGLPNVEDTESIVAKAIRDGGIDATIDHEHSYMSSKEVTDIYSTEEPQSAFHARVAFCLDIHNEAVRAMRFDPAAHKPKDKLPTERTMTDAEVAKAIEEAESEEP